MQLPKVGIAAIILSLMTLQPVFAAEYYREEGVRIGAGEFKEVPGVRFGQATIKTAFSAMGQYDNNVFWTPNNTKKDYIFTLMPKVLVDLPFGIDERHLIQLMYVGEGGLFSRQTKQNYMNNAGAGNVNLRLPFGFFNVNDVYKSTSDRAGTEFTTRVKRIENTVSTTLGVEMNKFTSETSFSNFHKEYTDPLDKFLDYHENVYDETLFYQLFPKTKALIDYSFGQVDYSKNHPRGGHFNQLVAGLKGDLTGKTVGIAKFGFHIRDYRSGKGYTGYVAEVGTVTKFSDRTQVTFNYNTAPVESTYSNSNYYITNAVRAELEQKLIENFSALIRSGASRNFYPQTDSTLNLKRRDWILNEEFWLQYKVKEWSKVSVGYQYERRSSNVGTQAYADNLVSTRLDFFF